MKMRRKRRDEEKQHLRIDEPNVERGKEKREDQAVIPLS